MSDSWYREPVRLPPYVDMVGHAHPFDPEHCERWSNVPRSKPSWEASMRSLHESDQLFAMVYEDLKRSYREYFDKVLGLDRPMSEWTAPLGILATLDEAKQRADRLWLRERLGETW